MCEMLAACTALTGGPPEVHVAVARHSECILYEHGQMIIEVSTGSSASSDLSAIMLARLFPTASRDQSLKPCVFIAIGYI